MVDNYVDLPTDSSTLAPGSATAANQALEIVQLTAINSSTASALTLLTNIDSKLTSPLAVTGTFWQATQPINGIVTANLGTIAGVSTEITLSAINTKVPSNLTVTATRLLVDGSGVTQPISAIALPLPSGAATETTLLSIDNKLPAQYRTLDFSPINTFSQEFNTTGMQSGLILIVGNPGGTISVEGSLDGVTYVSSSSNPVSIYAIGQGVVSTSNNLNNAGQYKADFSVWQKVKFTGTISGTPAVYVGASSLPFGIPTIPDGHIFATTSIYGAALGLEITETDNSGKVSLDVNVSNASLPVTGTFWQATQPVSAVALTNIDSKTPALGQAAMTVSIPVVIASNQSSIPVAATLTAETTKVIGTINIAAGQAIQANAGTNLNTSALALEAGGNLAATATALQIMDDWDEIDRAKVNPIVGQAGVQGASGIVSPSTQRVVLATDVALPAGTNGIGKLTANSGVVIGAIEIATAQTLATVTTVSTVTAVTAITNALPVGNNNIGDVDAVSVIPGTGATNLGKAEDGAHTTGDVGVMALGVRNDANASLTSTDLDYSPIAVTPAGLIKIVQDSPVKTTYGSSILNLATAATATDVVTLSGSATKTVKIIEIGISGSATTAVALGIQLIKRSTTNTTGTSTTPAIVPFDSANAPGTAVFRAYTANPGALGTAVGTLKVHKLLIDSTTVTSNFILYQHGSTPGQPIVLRGVGEFLAINFNSTTITGSSMCIYMVWTEE